MGQEPEELRRDIATRRAEMTETIDAIEDRVSPSRVVARRQEAAKSRLRGWRERVMGSPDDDETYGYGDIYGSPTATYGTYEGTYESNALAPDMPRQSGGGQGMTDQARERASGMAHDAADRASGAAHEAADMARHAPETVKRQAQGNPLAAGLVAFGAGLLAASVIPESRTERRAVARMQPQLDQVAEEAGRAGQDLAESAKSTAQEEAQGLKESASEKADQVKGHAQESGQEVKGQAQQKGKEVKDQARQGGGSASR